MVLSAARVRSLAQPGRFTDEKGLHLWVRSDGRRSWVLRYRLGTKQKDMGLGGYPDVSLADARKAADKARGRLRVGEDPISARKTERAAQVREVEGADQRSFETLARRYISTHEPTWRNAKHREQWRNTLASYAYPKIGSLDVAAIGREAVLTVLEPIWRRAPETASRLRGRIETILDYAAARGLRDAANPARWRDLQHELPPAHKLQPVQNQPALPWRKLPAFIGELRARQATAARALEFLILTATRTSETIGATWREIDEQHAIWTIPARRMKAGRPHRVPLASEALAILQVMHPLRTSLDSYVFPGPREKSGLSSMAFLMLLRRMQGTMDGSDAKQTSHIWADQDGRPITAHGFRATFRTWAGDATDFPREVIEAAMAHTLKDKAEAAYARGDLLEKRRVLMAAWAAFIEPVSASAMAAGGEQVA